MGLDLGDRRIGVALSDELGVTAQPLTTLEAGGTRAALAYLKDLAREHGVDRVVIGLPLNLNGTEGPRARSARAFAERAERELGLPCTLWDERLSTAEAERMLVGADVSRRGRRKVVDRIAAQLILQGYLDLHGARSGAEDDP